MRKSIVVALAFSAAGLISGCGETDNAAEKLEKNTDVAVVKAEKIVSKTLGYAENSVTELEPSSVAAGIEATIPKDAPAPPPPPDTPATAEDVEFDIPPNKVVEKIEIDVE